MSPSPPIGVPRFELGTSPTRTERATRLRHTPSRERVAARQPIGRPNNIGRPAAWLQIAPGQELHLVEVADFDPSPFDAEFGRHVALAVPLGEFDALQRRLRAHGVTLIEPQRATPFARFFFRDPNGYVFEVVEDVDTQT